MYRLVDESAFAAFRRRVSQAMLADRELMVRSGGRVRHLRLPRRSQLLLLAWMVVGIGWVGYASIAYLRLNHDLAETEDRIALANAVNAELRADMEDTRRRFLAIAGTLEKNHGQLESLIKQDDRLSRQSGSETDTKLARGESRSERLRRHLSALEDQVLATTSRNETLASHLHSTKSRLDEEVAEKQRAQQRGKVLADNVSRLRQRLTSIEASQRSLLGRLTRAAEGDVDRVRALLKKTGLKVEDLLASLRPKSSREDGDGQGGPFVPEGEVGGGDRVDEGLIAFHAQLERWREVQRLVRSIPLSQPVKRYRISSRYGSRKDPVNGRRAFHGGVDLAGPRNQPVRVTAHGEVIRAGRVGRYGRFVEVEHSNGIRTRYGHLAKILVKKGQRLRKGHVLGLLGSSGRSTGPHLHYEIVIRGKLVDPLKFLKVGKHVFKG